jgi:hypothetical protein
VIRLADVPDVGRVDGSWRDIYVLGTSVADWDAVLGLVRAGRLGSATYTLDTEPASGPESAAAAFAVREEASPMLSLDVEGLILNCHFFCDDVIEFDLNPAELSESNFAALMGWMRLIGSTLRRDVLLTEENAPQLPLLVYQPAIDRVLAVSKTDRELTE